ncbi:exonuclease SbcCD subunit D [Alkaliphilus transvaalensis]|uniref:exonuclease SbcCD subunit D n=1 Tax=Alkaliphilus transvaalensis TaxID=114628 RepID=UPI00047A07F7|nr:exonuclease SbcCD subunit D [Alkaliphilus transvaalensis]
MKIFHTSDWHIGKLVHQIHMTEDQRHILEQFVELVKEEKPDCIIIAGDLYDRSVPPVEAVELLDEVFSKILIELEIPILAIAGNHDSPDRLGFANKILKNKGLYISGKLTKELEAIVLEDEHGPVNFYLVPYADPIIVRDITENKEIQGHDHAMKVLLDGIKGKMNPQERHVVVAHGFITGAEALETSESERPLSIGGTDYIDANYFKDFHYTALGHLHSPQKVVWDKVRYAGSLMKYSFSESKQKKSITIVEMDGKGEIEVRQVSLTPKRDMRRVMGELKELLQPHVYENANIEDYLMVTLTDEGELIDAIGKLRTVYPNVLRLDRHTTARNKENDKISAGENHHKRTKLELFQEFYKKVTDQDCCEAKSTILAKVLNQLEAAERGK